MQKTKISKSRTVRKEIEKPINRVINNNCKVCYECVDVDLRTLEDVVKLADVFENLEQEVNYDKRILWIRWSREKFKKIKWTRNK